MSRRWLSSLRYQSHGNPIPAEGIAVIWHRDLLLALPLFKNSAMSILLSASRDGDWARELCEPWRYRVVRGSSSRSGSSGLRELIRSLNKNPLVGMALDGPRGPALSAKAGTVWLSKKFSLPVFPISFDSKTSYRLNNWDRTVTPLPFTVVDYFIGRPLCPIGVRELEDSMLRNERELKSKLIKNSRQKNRNLLAA